MKKFILGFLTGLALAVVWSVAWNYAQPCETDMECEMRHGGPL
jgi:hypothetical protein